MLLDRNIDDFSWGSRRIGPPARTISAVLSGDGSTDTTVTASAAPATAVALDPSATSPVTAVSGSISVPSPNATGFVPDFSTLNFTAMWDRLVTAVESHWIALAITLALIWLDTRGGKKK